MGNLAIMTASTDSLALPWLAHLKNLFLEIFKNKKKRQKFNNNRKNKIKIKRSPKCCESAHAKQASKWSWARQATKIRVHCTSVFGRKLNALLYFLYPRNTMRRVNNFAHVTVICNSMKSLLYITRGWKVHKNQFFVIKIRHFYALYLLSRVIHRI